MTVYKVIHFCLLMTTSTAFPYPQQSQPAEIQDPGQHCSLIAINKMLDAYQLPVIEKEVIDHARYRDGRERTLNTNNRILQILIGNELTKLPVNEDTFGMFGDLSGTPINDDLSEKRKQILIQMNKIINDITSIQEECIQRIRSESNSFGNSEEIRYLAPQDAVKDKILLADTNIAGTDLEDRFPKRNSLALNPSGWRKRRSSVETDQERVQHFLRNMRQLLNKRQQRLNFNPTGW